MGNCFSVQLSGGDAFINRCWDCIAPRCDNLPQLQPNLQNLAYERDLLRALKDDVKQKVSNQQGPLMKQLDVVRVWVSKVESKLPEVDRLIIDGEDEKNKLCLGGYCSKTCFSSYTFATEIVETLTDVIALKQNGNFETVVERVVGEPEYISQLENDLLALQAATEELKALKDDVIRRVKVEEGPQMKQLEQVKVWISRVDLMIPLFHSLITDGPQEIQWLRNEDLSFSSFGERVKKGLTDAVAIKESAGFEAVVGRVPIEPVVERPGEPALGLERMLEKVWNWLVEEEVGIIGIYGLGGVGKTTLLTKINNRFINSAHTNFDFVIWMVVSKDSKLEIMQDQIARRIGLSNDQLWSEKKFDEKAEVIFKVLQKKKFTLLLDDLWDRVELQQIGIPLPNRENKCKMVFTTRSEEVCGEMEAQRRIKVEPLVWEEAWKLFQDKVGRDALSADPNIPRVAEDVAKECAGLPLALVTVGRAMACKKTIQEWQYAVRMMRRSVSKLKGMGDRVFPILKFSYDNLPNEKVKSCLLYCSLFSEDYLIPKEDLIEKWVYENFWDDDGNNQTDAISEGHNIVATLAHACLLEDKGKWVKMHDVIRDMCLWIACKVEKEKENYFVEAGNQLTKAPDMRKWREVRRVSLMQNKIRRLAEVPDSPYLLTLFLCNNRELAMINDNFFQYMNTLTVLDLSGTGITVLPTGVSKLVSLQYLNISNTEIRELPWEFTNLKKLKCFSLAYSIRSFPRRMISHFQLLQILKMRCTFVDRQFLEELASLVDLEVLSMEIQGDPSNLPHLLTSHKLSSCIRNLKISRLKSDISSSSSSMTVENSPYGELIGAKTQTLCSLQQSLRKRCFASLFEVEIYGCHYLQDLTWLLLAPNLAELKVTSCRQLEEIISYRKLGEVMEEDQYEKLSPFARLQRLDLFVVPLLKSICWKPMLFPCLDRITVADCAMLKKLPLNSNSAKGRNLLIQGNINWWDELEWEDDASRNAFTQFEIYEEELIIDRKAENFIENVRYQMHLQRLHQ